MRDEGEGEDKDKDKDGVGGEGDGKETANNHHFQMARWINDNSKSQLPPSMCVTRPAAPLQFSFGPQLVCIPWP